MKNKMNKPLSLPEGTFTLDDVRNMNPNFIDITMRSRISKEIEKYNLEHIADINGGRGRPKMLLVKTPVLQKHIDEAIAKNAVVRPSVTVTVAEVTDTHLPNENITLQTKKKQSVLNALFSM